MLQNLAKLLGVIEPASRQQYVPLLCNLEMESDNWRFRQLLALQLGDLFHLYDEEVCVCVCGVCVRERERERERERVGPSWYEEVAFFCSRKFSLFSLALSLYTYLSIYVCVCVCQEEPFE